MNKCVAGKDRGAAGQSGDAVVECLAGQRPRGRGRSRPAGESPIPAARSATATARPSRAPQHPGQRRIKHESRLAGAVVGARCPVRIEDAVPPAVQRIEPGNQVEIEIVPAGSAAHQSAAAVATAAHSRMMRRPRHPPPADFSDLLISARSPDPLIPVPCSLSFHGIRRRVCRVWEATAAGLKGSAKVVPP